VSADDDGRGVIVTTTIDRQQLVSDVEALKAALEALPARDAIEKAIHHCERLRIAIRSSHTEGTRFAAFTVAKIVRDLAAELPPDIPAKMQAIKAALEATGLDLQR
jgi:hypothetical protein